MPPVLPFSVAQVPLMLAVSSEYSLPPTSAAQRSFDCENVMLEAS